jgi:DNA-binding XRE family transcriptional regulator
MLSQIMREQRKARGLTQQALAGRVGISPNGLSPIENGEQVVRMNATFRPQPAPLGRRSRHLAWWHATLTAGLHPVGTVYNFCVTHTSLPQVDHWRWRPTPAMAAELTDWCWSIGGLLDYQVLSPRWKPPTQRGRRAKALQESQTDGRHDYGSVPTYRGMSAVSKTPIGSLRGI